MNPEHCRYPEYAHSDMEWVDQLPSHWDRGKLRWLTHIFSGGTPDKGNLGYWSEGTIPWLASGEVNQCRITTPTAYITEDAFRNSSAKWVRAGSLVMAIAGQGKTKGTVAILDFDSTCNQSMAAIDPYAITARYLFYWLNSNYRNIRGLAGDGLRDGLNLNMIADIGCPIPSLDEQSAIANFLDRETAKIDTLIEKQERLIKLLQEKRQAVISHAVNKGLNSDVRMKDSGVEWLGEVPEHWKVVQIKRLSKVARGSSPRPIDDPSYFDDEGEYAWVRISDVTASSGVLESTEQRLSPLGAEFSVKLDEGWLFLSIAGSVGKPCITGIKACIHDGFVHFPYLEESPHFLFYVFLAGEAYRGLGKMGTQLNLNTDTVGWIKIGLPPREEQTAIVVDIRKRLEMIDLLIAQVRLFIELSMERRAALISAAVTGKIDVRNAV